MTSYKQKTWNDFCGRFEINNSCVPLFKCEGNVVSTIEIGRTNRRFVLERSHQMESLVIHEAAKVIQNYNEDQERFEGLIYMMCRKEGKMIIPLYIGKTEKYGRRSGNLSANIMNIETNSHKFCRWGYAYAYHIGDLSAVVCEGHPDKRKNGKYMKWADKLFKSHPSPTPILNHPTYFWVHAWEKGETGIWKEFGQTSLTFLEYLLIGVASDLFPNDILNDEGVNRH